MLWKCVPIVTTIGLFPNMVPGYYIPQLAEIEGYFGAPNDTDKKKDVNCICEWIIEELQKPPPSEEKAKEKKAAPRQLSRIVQSAILQ